MKKRNYCLEGKTYKIPVSSEENLYVTINSFAENPHKPFEIFLNSHSAEHVSELNALTLTLSALSRRDDISFIIEKFKQINSTTGGVWWNPGRWQKGVYVRSIPFAIALAIEMFLEDTDPEKCAAEPQKKTKEEKIPLEMPPKGGLCSKCGQFTITKRGGCEVCENPDCTYVGSCG